MLKAPAILVAMINDGAFVELAAVILPVALAATMLIEYLLH